MQQNDSTDNQDVIPTTSEIMPPKLAFRIIGSIGELDRDLPEYRDIVNDYYEDKYL